MTMKKTILSALACVFGFGCGGETDSTTGGNGGSTATDTTETTTSSETSGCGTTSTEAEGCAYDIQCQHLGNANCSVGLCSSGTCNTAVAVDGYPCVIDESNAGTCFLGECVDAITCDDGDPCTDDWIDQDGNCVGLPTTQPGKTCAFGAGDGVCLLGVCACDSSDDCDDGDPTTEDQCLDFECYWWGPA